MESCLIRCARPARHARRGLRGFTMVEMMVVVVIVGVLAVVGITLLRKHAFSSKSVEAMAMIQSIRAAQERWRAETTTYLDVSATMSTWYPMNIPGRTKYHWLQTGNDWQRWRLLNPTAPGPVQFGYATRAGAPGVSPSAEGYELNLSELPAWGVPHHHWYLIQAKADVDEDGVSAYYAASSFTGEVVSENEGE